MVRSNIRYAEYNINNICSAEDRREYLESLLRECKKEEAAPVLDDDSLNDIIARRYTFLLESCAS